MGRALFTNPTTLSNDADGVHDDHDDHDVGDGGELGEDDESGKEGHNTSMLIMMMADPSKTLIIRI